MESRVAGRFVDAGALVTPAVHNADNWNTADYAGLNFICLMMMIIGDWSLATPTVPIQLNTDDRTQHCNPSTLKYCCKVEISFIHLTTMIIDEPSLVTGCHNCLPNLGKDQLVSVCSA